MATEGLQPVPIDKGYCCTSLVHSDNDDKRAVLLCDTCFNGRCEEHRNEPTEFACCNPALREPKEG